MARLTREEREPMKRAHRLYRGPQAVDRKTANDIIFGFVVHATGHLNAAARLLCDTSFDPFAVAADQADKPARGKTAVRGARRSTTRKAKRRGKSSD